MAIEFAYLHNHTKYSVADAMPSMKEYVDFIYKYNQSHDKYHIRGFSVTDHGVVSGIVSQYEECNNPKDPERKTEGYYGCEIYHCMDIDNNPKNDKFHMVLLAATQEGLSNLYKITSHGGLNPIKPKSKIYPVTDLDFILNHAKGLVCLTACMSGLVPSLILQKRESEAIDIINKLESAFDAVYLEVQPLDLQEQYDINAGLVKLSNIYGYKLVMTCDSHYIYKEDIQYHKILKEISHQKAFDSQNYLRTPEEMEEYCLKYNIPLEAIYNTAEIADMCCNVDPKPKDHRALLPEFPVPKGYDPDSYLREKVFEMLPIRLMNNNIQDPKRYYKQALYELDVICSAGFASYFLILWDWFEWCRNNGILCGPGRGSAAGSIISYVLNITKVDPIKNGFYFERFLNRERLEFPDIDTDIPRDKRSEAIKYLLGKYGIDNVSQIATFNEYKLKNTLKGILSSQGCPFQEQNSVTKSIPDLVDGKPVTLEMIEEFNKNPEDPKFSSFSNNERQSLMTAWKNLQGIFIKYPIAYEGVKHITGCYSTMGVHAGGVIICRHSIKEHGQVMYSSDSAVLPVLQFEMHDLDFFGFLKIDVLGLKTLDTIKMTMDLVGLGYDWYDSEDYSDPQVYDMLKAGMTTDVFQMSKYSPTKMIADFNVTDIDGLCAVNAGNRPGPLEKDANTGKSMVDLYAEAIKTGVPQKWDPRIDPILSKTMGCIWYQEHCIQIGQVMAGYSLGSADIRVRKTLGKKLVKKIPEIRNEFIYGKESLFDEDGNVVGIENKDSKYCTGCIDHGFDEELGNKVFDTMAAFAKYSFNRSHAFCYAVIGYKTAWLSCHYPVEFAIANCTINEREEDIIETLASARKRKIKILPPDINHSEAGFSNDNGSIRYGFKAIKGIGTTALDFLSEFKKLSGFRCSNFDDFYNLIHSHTDPLIAQLIANLRAKTGKASSNPIKKDIEIAMILSGCFDFSEPNRLKLLNHYMIDIRKENGVTVKILDKDEAIPIDEKRYNRKMKLALEKHYMGTYISEHPLDPFPYIDLDNVNNNEQVKIGGIVVNAMLKKTKKGSEFLNLKIKTKDDMERTVNVFNEKLAKSLASDIKKNQIVVVKGAYNSQYHNINATEVKIAIFKKQMLQDQITDIDNLQSTPEEFVPEIPVVDAPIMANVWQ